jgi:hypothetical protein
MSVELIDCEQNSELWFRSRLGLPTASNFAAILAKGEGKTRRSYLLRLAGEVVTGEPSESYSNEWMERGHRMEPDARALYGFSQDVEPQIVGFIRNGDKGASPDSLIGDRGLLEIKSKRADLLIDVLIKGEFPNEHKAQCQGALWVAEREWIDIACYWPGLPLFVKRAGRDEEYISKLADAVEMFNFELQQTVKWIRAYGQEPAA